MRLIRYISLSLSLLFLLSFCLLPAAHASPEMPYASLVTASDFQGSEEAFPNFGAMLAQIKAHSCSTPDAYLFGGDYGNTNEVNPRNSIPKVLAQVEEFYSESSKESMIFVQGNHDAADPSGLWITPTGLYEFKDFFVFVLNEDSYCARQTKQGHYPQAAKDLSARLQDVLLPLTQSNDCRPVFVVAHVPLHHSSRYDYGDTLYSSYLFDVLNRLGKTLDIIFLFGHNHSSVYDDYIGGSVNYLPRGSIIRIPIPDTAAQGPDGYKEETLSFTYMNYGYVGYSNNTDSESSTSAITAGLIELYSNRIVIRRFDKGGQYSAAELIRRRPLDYSSPSFHMPVILLHKKTSPQEIAPFCLYFHAVLKD